MYTESELTCGRLDYFALTAPLPPFPSFPLSHSSPFSFWGQFLPSCRVFPHKRHLCLFLWPIGWQPEGPNAFWRSTDSLTDFLFNVERRPPFGDAGFPASDACDLIIYDVQNGALTLHQHLSFQSCTPWRSNIGPTAHPLFTCSTRTFAIVWQQRHQRFSHDWNLLN